MDAIKARIRGAVERDWLLVGPITPWRSHEELAAENARLHRVQETLCDWANLGWERVLLLNKRVWRLIDLARGYRDPEPKRGRPARLRSEYRERMMIMRYIHLDGREHGKGARAKWLVAQEFKSSVTEVERLITEYAAKTVTEAEAIRDILEYRARYEQKR
jgi:hypothetical protein